MEETYNFLFQPQSCPSLAPGPTLCDLLQDFKSFNYSLHLPNLPSLPLHLVSLQNYFLLLFFFSLFSVVLQSLENLSSPTQNRTSALCSGGSES